MAKLLSVNAGRPQPLEWKGRSVISGIVKTAIEGNVALRTRGLEGDGQADLDNHGRPFQAVYTYPFEHYAYWQEQLGRDSFPPGQFGENLTTEGLLESNVHLGDIFRIGSALVQVTSFRYPCGKFAMRMQRNDFPLLFLQSLRSGWYMRVLEEGTITSGDSIELQQSDVSAPTIEDMLITYLQRPVDSDAVNRVLRIKNLAPEMRAQFQHLVSEIAW